MADLQAAARQRRRHRRLDVEGRAVAKHLVRRAVALSIALVPLIVIERLFADRHEQHERQRRDVRHQEPDLERGDELAERDEQEV